MADIQAIANDLSSLTVMQVSELVEARSRRSGASRLRPRLP